jgi:lipoic acid synthetase
MNDVTKPVRADGQRGADKVSRLPVRIEPTPDRPPRKPPWIRARAPTQPAVMRLKQLLRTEGLHTVCEEASCPNLGECFAGGTATFMIMGRLCTRRCPFCDVAHGRPEPLDATEPQRLAQAVATMALRYVVITSVDRDDLRDGGGAHFAACIAALRGSSPTVSIEILVPDFRGRVDRALTALGDAPPDVFNHNLETVPRLYAHARPGADYAGSLALLQRFRELQPKVPTKSGIMLGLGEEIAEVESVLRDLRTHGCDRLTLGQYLQPSRAHLPVTRYVPPDEFDALAAYARSIGFSHVAAGPMVRSSYHAEAQAAGQEF